MNTNPKDNVVADKNILFESWLLQNRRLSSLINKLSGEEIYKNIACGKNSVAYLLGHLIASNDQLMEIFNFGSLLYPEYQDLFLKTPDKCGQKYPNIDTLKSDWFLVNKTLASNFEKYSLTDWSTRQEELTAMQHIINHQSYHHGQLSLIY